MSEEPSTSSISPAGNAGEYEVHVALGSQVLLRQRDEASTKGVPKLMLAGAHRGCVQAGRGAARACPAPTTAGRARQGPLCPLGSTESEILLNDGFWRAARTSSTSALPVAAGVQAGDRPTLEHDARRRGRWRSGAAPHGEPRGQPHRDAAAAVAAAAAGAAILCAERPAVAAAVATLAERRRGRRRRAPHRVVGVGADSRCAPAWHGRSAPSSSTNYHKRPDGTCTRPGSRALRSASSP